MRKRTKQPILAVTREMQKECRKFHEDGRIAFAEVEWKFLTKSSWVIRGWEEWRKMDLFLIKELKKGNSIVSYSVSPSTSVPKKYDIGTTRTDKLLDACIQEIERVVKYFSKKYKKDIPMPFINTNKKKGMCAGTCYSNGEIKLNWRILKAAREEYINRTPGHEAIHWVQYLIFKRMDHGPQFKQMAKEVGIPSSRCHSYDLSKVGYVRYKCECQYHYLTRRMHNKVKLFNSKRTCVVCRSDLAHSPRKEAK